jgi:hypothetical protein
MPIKSNGNTLLIRDRFKTLQKLGEGSEAFIYVVEDMQETDEKYK